MNLLKALEHFIWERKKFWLIPFVLMLVLFAFLLFVTQSSEIAPFVYTL
jgi:hypothetical protein